MTMSKIPTPTSRTERIRIAVPAEVARYYEAQARRYGIAASAAAAPVLCAQGRGEIKNEFTSTKPETARP